MTKQPQVKFNINKNFLLLLKMKGWKKGEFAKKIGYTPEQLSAVINNKEEPSRQMLRRICSVLRCEMREIVDTIFY